MSSLSGPTHYLPCSWKALETKVPAQQGLVFPNMFCGMTQPPPPPSMPNFKWEGTFVYTRCLREEVQLAYALLDKRALAILDRGLSTCRWVSRLRAGVRGRTKA